MNEKKQNDAALEALFASARAAPPDVPDALMSRVLADARALQPAAGRTGWRDVAALLGGLPALGGLITATCAGFWIGVAPPEALPDIGALLLGTEPVAEIDAAGVGWDIEEG